MEEDSGLYDKKSSQLSIFKFWVSECWNFTAKHIFVSHKNGETFVTVCAFTVCIYLISAIISQCEIWDFRMPLTL